MDASQINGNAIREHIKARVDTLIQSFELILVEAMMDGHNDLSATMEKGFRTELISQGMIRSSEDLLSLVRQMQEMWLFGKLDTLRQEEAEETDLLELMSDLVTNGLVNQNQK